MIEKDLRPYDKEPDKQDIIKHIFEEGKQNPLVLSAAPTATEPLLEDNQDGIYSDEVYIRKGTKIYKLTPDEVITIT